jgi:retron-type reverse transcriptase
MTGKNNKLLSEESQRHAEYYGMQSVFDGLYAKSKNGEVFTALMPLIISRENILLAYRSIKTNTGSRTEGTDGLTIGDIGRLMPDEMVEQVRRMVSGHGHGYRPKPVRRKEIPKPYDPTKTRPLGIPCIWDRLIQQCVRQIMEPICEAKFSDNS